MPNGGKVLRCSSVGDWFGGHISDGVRLQPINGGEIDDIEFIAPKFYGDTFGGDGVRFGAGVKNVTGVGGRFAGIAGAALHYEAGSDPSNHWTDPVFGPCGGIGANGQNILDQR